MARIQILELPTEHHGDDMVTPFAIVIDQASEATIAAIGMDTGKGTMMDGLRQALSVSVAEQLGARAVLVFEDTVELPANDATAYLGGALPPDAHYEMTINGQPVTWSAVDETQARKAEALRLAHERTDIARDMDRLAKRKNELLDALGMDLARDWDDIRNAARGLRKERDEQFEKLERVRNLSEQPEVMDAQHEQPQGYLHGYKMATREAKRAVRSFRPSESADG